MSAPPLDLTKELAPAAKEIAGGHLAKAIPLLSGAIALAISGNPLLGAAVTGASQLGLDSLIARSATKKLVAAELKYEEEREALVQVHLLSALEALRNGDIRTLGLLVQSALAEAGAEREEQFLQLARLVDRGFESVKSEVRDARDYSANQFESIVAQLGAIQRSVVLNPDADFDESVELLNVGDVETARVMLRRLRARKWEALDAAKRARVLTMLGDCELRSGYPLKSAELMLEAQRIAPDAEYALVNACLAYLLLNRRSDAVAMGDAAIARAPNSGSAWGARLQCALPDEFCDIAAAVPLVPRGHPEVAIVIAVNCNLLPESAAEEAATAATILAPEDPRAWHALAAHRLRQQFGNSAGTDVIGSRRPDCTAVAQIEQLLEVALEKAKKRADVFNSVNALLLRASAKESIGRIVDADADVEQAAHLLPKDSRVVVACADMLERRGEVGSAVRNVRLAITEDTAPELRFTLAGLLWRRNEDGDRIEATTLALVLSREGGSFAEHSLHLAVEGLLAAGSIADAENAVVAGSCSAVLLGALRARIYSASSAEDAARQAAQQAFATRTSSTQRLALFALAKVLGRLGLHSEAFEIWQDLSRSGDDQCTRSLVECAVRLRRYGVALQHCRALREEGRGDDILLSWELWILRQHDPEAALALLLSLQDKQPINPRVALQIAVLALERGRQALALEQFARLPTVLDADADEGADVVHLLVAFGRPQEASLYAYDLLRRHFGSARVHTSFVHAVLLGDRASNDQPMQHDFVRPGSAVCFREGHSSAEQWVVLEDSTVPRGPDVPGEVAPDSEIALALLGKAAGDRVVLASAPGQDRLAVIVRIMDKITHRIQDVLHGYQLRFKEPGLWQYRLGQEDPGNPAAAFAPLLSLLEQRAAETDRAEAAYAQGKLTLYAFGNWLGIDAVAAQCHVASRPGLILRTCLGSREEYLEASSAFAVAAGLVLDASALVTLALLGQLDLLLALEKEIVVPQSALSLIRHGTSFQSVVPGPEVKSAILGSSEAVDIDRVRVTAWIETNANVVGCLAVADLDPDVRERSLTLVGQPCLEAAVLASTGSRVLWSDDGLAGAVMCELTGARRVWTGLVLTTLAEARKLAIDRHDGAVAQLIGWGHVFTPLSPRIFRRAAEIAGWRVDKRPLRESVDYLGSKQTADQYAVLLAVTLVVASFGAAPLLELRQRTLVAVFEALLRRESGRTCVESAERLLRRSFGVNLIGERDALAALDDWRRRARALL
jgi:tetratricopeptide (TPR) repeat protein